MKQTADTTNSNFSTPHAASFSKRCVFKKMKQKICKDMQCDSLSVAQKQTLIIHCDLMGFFQSDSVSEVLVRRIL
jgi:hypothetical protein